MTTTKEDQMRAEFEAEFREFAVMPAFYEAAYKGWKACAESYEKKLAEKENAIAHYKNDQVLTADIERKLSEANKRNAMLVEALTEISTFPRARMPADIAREAISANSEAVAAWEAEKLEPLHREVVLTKQNLSGCEVSLKLALTRARCDRKDLEAAQLHITELNIVLKDLLGQVRLFCASHGEDDFYTGDAEQALTKQPDTSALDKALLEARIDQMEDVLAWHPLDGSHEEYDAGLMRDLRAKLAELNKE